MASASVSPLNWQVPSHIFMNKFNPINLISSRITAQGPEKPRHRNRAQHRQFVGSTKTQGRIPSKRPPHSTRSRRFED